MFKPQSQQEKWLWQTRYMSLNTKLHTEMKIESGSEQLHQFSQTENYSSAVFILFLQKSWTAPEKAALTLYASHNLCLKLTWLPFFAHTAVTMASFSDLFSRVLSASSSLFSQLSFFSLGFQHPPNSGICFLSGASCHQEYSSSLNACSRVSEV